MSRDRVTALAVRRERGCRDPKSTHRERVFVAATELMWSPLGDTGEIPRALLMVLSVTGAGLFAPTYPFVRVNDVMIVGLNGARAVVCVRRAHRTDDENLRYFSVEFVSMEPAFQRQVFDVIGRGRPNDSRK